MCHCDEQERERGGGREGERGEREGGREGREREGERGGRGRERERFEEEWIEFMAPDGRQLWWMKSEQAGKESKVEKEGTKWGRASMQMFTEGRASCVWGHGGCIVLE